jgi:hypothetical protein
VLAAKQNKLLCSRLHLILAICIICPATSTPQLPLSLRSRICPSSLRSKLLN